MDPTRTVTLRRAALRAVKVKFARLRGLLVKLVVGEDAFGLGMLKNVERVEMPQAPPITTNRFQFHSSPDKVLAFQKWLRQQYKALLLGKSDEELWAEFARLGYEKGAGRAFDDVNKKRRWSPGEGDFYGRSKQEFLKSSFGRAESADKLRLLASRSFTDLKNVTEDMATRMSRTLMDGLARGANPRDLVDDLMDDLDVSETRAETIARSEIIRAHAEGQLDALEKLGVEEVGVAVEWDTAKDGRVCRHCLPLQGVVLTIQEAHGLIPAHPNCRCAFIPANVGEDDSKQIRGKAEILEAFEEAEIDPPELDEERPKPLVEATKNQQALDDEEYHFHRDQQEDAAEISNVFCATGEGGGVDPSCSPHDAARFSHLSKDERGAINDWIGLTDTYRASIASGKPTKEATRFLKVLDKLPNYEGAVYRGIRGPELAAQLEKIGVGGMWTDKAPMSTTSDRAVAAKYSDHTILKITVKTAKAIPDMEGAEEFGSQSEVVTQPGTTYRIKRIRGEMPYEAGGVKRIAKKFIELEEIGPNSTEALRS